MKSFLQKFPLCLLLCCQIALGETEEMHNTHAAGLSVSIGSMSTRPDVAFARSVMGNNLPGMKGAIGESLTESVFLQKDSKGHSWKSIRPRSGPQGLDHIFIKLDENGFPHDLMIAESKYGSSQLGLTKDGIQMGGPWKSKRIIALGNRYAHIAKTENIQPAKRPQFSGSHVHNVTLKSGKDVHFWRKDAKSPWKFDGDISDLAEAQRLAEHYGKFLQAAGNGTVSYRSRIFHLNPVEQDMRITIYDADNISHHTTLKQLPVTGEVVLPGALDKKGLISDDVRNLIAQKIMTTCDLPEGKAMQIAKDCQKNMTLRQGITPNSQVKAITLSSGLMGAGSVGLDAGIQLLVNQKVSGFQLAYSGAVATVGGALVQGVEQYAIGKGLSMTRYGRSAATLMMPRAFIRGSGIFAAVDALAGYGLAMSGKASWNEAHQGAVVSAGATVASIGAYSAMMAAPAALSMAASTGTAISSLSGAAASNATLAIYGGGTLAAGGGGAAMGALVVGGGVAIIAVGTGYLIYKCIQLHDDHQDSIRINELANFYSQDKNWEIVLNYQSL
ncbi:MAG: hypothetical protein E7032_02750 [Akkermansiaceae bacterium]|nr:hypothetical protein [Akkermansiaceae bacterium]